MRKLYTLILISLTVLGSAKATTWTITNSGFTFSPATITIDLGDTVMFNLGGSHNSVEVSMATWNANGNTSNGGFTIPFGGGMLVPTMVKTYYYVCNPHASLGMKGQIIVNNSTGIPTPENYSYSLNFAPNPAVNQTRVQTGFPDGLQNSLQVFDITGKLVESAENIHNNYLLDLSVFNKGIYFVEFKSEGYRRVSKLVVSSQ